MKVQKNKDSLWPCLSASEDGLVLFLFSVACALTQCKPKT